MNRGLDRERRVMRLMEADGWLVASRRHVGGAGDILAVRATLSPDAEMRADVRLVEVKSTRSPWSHFPPSGRRAMLDAARLHDAEPWLAWWPAHGKLEWIPATAWPWIPATAWPDVRR